MSEVVNSGATGLATGNRFASPKESPFNTSVDVFMTRLWVIDPATLNPTPLFGYCDDLKVEIKNNVSPNEALGVLGAFEASAGNFVVTGSVEAYFQTVAAAAAIKNNADVALSTILARANAGMTFDIPLLQLGGGINKVEKDRPVKVPLTTEAGTAPTGFTFSTTVFSYLPNAAMPA